MPSMRAPAASSAATESGLRRYFQYESMQALTASCNALITMVRNLGELHAVRDIDKATQKAHQGISVSGGAILKGTAFMETI